MSAMRRRKKAKKNHQRGNLARPRPPASLSCGGDVHNETFAMMILDMCTYIKGSISHSYNCSVDQRCSVCLLTGKLIKRLTCLNWQVDLSYIRACACVFTCASVAYRA